LSNDKTNFSKQNDLQKGENKLRETICLLHQTASEINTKDLTLALQNIEKSKLSLTKNLPQNAKTNFKGNSNSLQTSTKALLSATSQLSVIAKSNPALLGSIAKMTGATTSQLLTLASACASSSKDQSVADMLLLTARALADAMKNLLNGAKTLSVNRTPQMVQEFTTAI